MFLDLEASSLAPDSWPIEIGCAWIANGRVQSEATLIRPRADWSMTAWTETAAAVHGLSVEDVMRGECADRVAAETDALAGYAVVSDNPVHDQAWLDRLRRGRPRIRVQGLRQIVATGLDGYAADMFSLYLLRAPCEHRAEADARRLADAWLGASTLCWLAA